MNKKIVASILALAVAAPIGVAIAKGEMHGHPNLQAAEALIKDAYIKVQAAQKANEYDMGGHAKKAEESLKVAADEIHMAAAAANEAHGK
jgi:hypothetical protein